VGKREDFDRAYARFFAPIRAKSGRILAHPQAADDLTQDVFFRFWQWDSRPAIDSPEGARTVLAWLYRTCTNLAIDALRARARTPRGDDEGPWGLPCTSDLAAALAARTAIASLAGSVPDDELQAAVLCRVDGLSQGEAAVILETTERTVRRLLARFDERTAPIRKEFAR
jgi:RNA polymerase sigma-70 factor (ECF subfamily)